MELVVFVHKAIVIWWILFIWEMLNKNVLFRTWRRQPVLVQEHTEHVDRKYVDNFAFLQWYCHPSSCWKKKHACRLSSLNTVLSNWVWCWLSQSFANPGHSFISVTTELSKARSSLVYIDTIWIWNNDSLSPFYKFSRAVKLIILRILNLFILNRWYQNVLGLFDF